MRSPKDIPSRFVHFRLFEGCRRRWALLIASTLAIVLAAGAVLMACKDDVRAVPAKLFETKIVTRGQGPAKWHYFDYNLPKAGSATLRLSNGARTDAPPADRVAGAEVTLRGKGVVAPKEFNQRNDVLEVPVELQAGTNRLGVRLQADSGKRVSLSIDAPADKIVLSPVPNAAVVGREPLRARAAVTALGRPVRRAEVQFEVLKLGRTIARKTETSNAGVATAYLSGFDAGKGELQAKLIGTDLTDVVPITALAKRTLSMRQRPISVRVEVGSVRTFGLDINLDEVQGDQEIVTLDHVVRPVPKGNPKGILIRHNFPSQGQVVTTPKNFSVSSTVTAVNPGRYSVTTTVAVGDKTGAKARESFSTELTVVVVPAGTPDPLRLSKPLISPSGITPGTQRVVTFRTLITGVANPPQVLYLDRVSNRGEFIAQETELRDDGKGPDAKAGDGFYSGRREFGSETETEFYFRLRTEYFDKTLTSGIAVLPITHLPLGSRPSVGPVVNNPGGQSKIFTNEVVVGAFAGVSPRRVRKITAEVGEMLGFIPPDNVLEIVGYIPSINSYLVEFKLADTPNTLQLVNRAIAVFSSFDAEVRYVSSSIQGRLAADSDWWLENIGVNDLRSNSLPSWFPKYGSGDIGVAIIDNGADCMVSDEHPDPDNHPLDGQCADPSSPDWAIAGSCLDIYNRSSPSDYHGTKVAALVAGKTDIADTDTFQGIDEGVAWDVKLLPFDINGLQQHGVAAAMDCAVTAGAHILNVSWEGDDPEEVLKDAVCNAIDNNRLIVAPAGNYACSYDLSRYPASYNDDSITCPDTTVPGGTMDIDTNGWMLKVGGTDNNNDRGEVCGADTINKKSQLGEIYAPGWGVPVYNDDDPDSDDKCDPNSCYATCWSAALVSGCAAIIGAVQKEIDPDWWNPNFVESRIRDTSSGTPRLLNCSAAVAEPKDIVLVLDRSGSMNLTENIYTTVADNRWEALQMAVGEFTTLIPEYAQPSSRFGLTLFATQVFDDMTPNFQYNNSAFHSGLIDIDSNLNTAVNTELEMQSPSGETAMGAGLQDGITKADTIHPRVVVLFTDGEQNFGFPQLELDGCHFTDGTEVNPSCLTEGEAGSTRVFAVGVGSPNGDYLDRLQNLARNNGGKFIVTDNGTDFSNECTASLLDIWDCAVALVFYGDSPQMVSSHKGVLSDTATIPPFDLNKRVDKLLIKLSFSRKLERSELISILNGVRIMKDSTDITNYFQPVFPGNVTNSVLLKTNFVNQSRSSADRIAPEGRYSVQITAPTGAPDLGYKFVSYADDHLLDMDWQVKPAAPRAQQDVSPTIRLNWHGKPLMNANVEALVLRPGEDLGDLLAKHPKKIDPSNAIDAGSPGYQKYLHLMKKDPHFLAQLRPKEQRFILTHQGDGEYSASYNSRIDSGIYQIVYQIRAESAEFGKIQRKAVQSVYVRFGDIDLDESAVTTTVSGQTVTINFRPVTTYGRFIGPAQGNAFTVDGAGIRLSSVTDHQDGSYTLALIGNPDTQVSIKLLGEEIYKGQASKVGKGYNLSGYLIWLIIVLILLLLIWLIRAI